MEFRNRLASRATYVVALAALVLLPSCKDHDTRPEPYAPATVPVVLAPPSQALPPPAPTAGSRVPEIRVAISKDAQSLRLTAPASGARIVLNGQPWRKLAAGAAVNITYSGATILLEGQPAGASSVRFESLAPDDALRLNDRDASGTLTVSHPSGRAGLLAVALLNLDEYLAGVLAGEVPYDRWHPEALRAQAVVSRTFAMYEMRGRTGDLYDVESTVMSQVFKSGYKSVPALMTAVLSTRGLALTSGGALFPAYFHSTCGGHTEAAAGIFPEFAGVKPLCGVTCPYCTQSPSYRWRASFSKEQIAAKLRTQIPNIGTIESISFADSKGIPVGNTSADLRRVQVVSIKHSNGVSQLQGNAFRLAVGPKELKSLLFGQVIDRGDTLDFGGGGFGHGVGLCQYGMEGMAAAGQPYTNILGFYYPGAALTRVY